MSRLESLKIKAKLLQKAKHRAGTPIPLKKAFEILARSAGHPSWRDMKKEVEAHSVFRPSGVSLPYGNSWYATYEEAKGFHREEEEFLLPYENQFFLCGVDYLESLGLEQDDADLLLVGSDWVKPKDTQAFERILKKIRTLKK